MQCRMDHYQTPLQVHVSAFAKGADKAKSTVRFEAQQVGPFIAWCWSLLWSEF